MNGDGILFIFKENCGFVKQKTPVACLEVNLSGKINARITYHGPGLNFSIRRKGEQDEAVFLSPFLRLLGYSNHPIQEPRVSILMILTKVIQKAGSP